MAYDEKCLACHASRGGAKQKKNIGAACPNNTSNCVSCHMAKYTVPEMHGEFTDHFIRIVRPGFPE